MRRQGYVRAHVIVYENHDVEVARYTMKAESERQAEIRTSALFFEHHPEFDQFDRNPRCASTA